MIVSIHNAKGHKREKLQPLLRFFQITKDPSTFPYYPIILVLIHALRHSIVFRTTLNNVLSNAAADNRGVIRWRYPEYPLLPGLEDFPSEMEKPTHRRMFNLVLRSMATVAGVQQLISA